MCVSDPIQSREAQTMPTLEVVGAIVGALGLCFGLSLVLYLVDPGEFVIARAMARLHTEDALERSGVISTLALHHERLVRGLLTSPTETGRARLIAALKSLPGGRTVAVLVGILRACTDEAQARRVLESLEALGDSAEHSVSALRRHCGADPLHSSAQAFGNTAQHSVSAFRRRCGTDPLRSGSEAFRVPA